MISEKMKSLVSNSSAIRAMFEEGKRLSKIYGQENVYDFSLGNPNVATPDEVKQAAIEILQQEDPIILHGYMSNSGYEDVRAAIAENLNTRFDTAFTEDNVLMTVGAAGGLNVILKTLLNPEDEVIVFAPFFGEYQNYVSNFDGNLVVISPNTRTFQPNLEELKTKITPKTKAIIVNSPNNPTGVVYAEETIKQLARILRAAQKEVQHPIYLISDEPYRELVYDGVTVPYLTRYYKNTIVGYSFSKSLSLPGERIGYLVIPSEIDFYDDILNAAIVANRILGFVNAPSFQQKIVGKCCNLTTDIHYYNKNRELIYQNLIQFGFECIKPQGAFYLFIKSPISNEKEFCEKAKEHNILLVPGSSFGCAGFVRLAYCVSYEMIQKSLPAFERLAQEYNLK